MGDIAVYPQNMNHVAYVEEVHPETYSIVVSSMNTNGNPNATTQTGPITDGYLQFIHRR